MTLDRQALIDGFAAVGFIADPQLAMAVSLMRTLERPLLLEGDAGVGKTEVSKALSAVIGAPLIRLQCYEGLDVASAVYEWNYPAQMMAIRLAEASGGSMRLGRPTGGGAAVVVEFGGSRRGPSSTRR